MVYEAIESNGKNGEWHVEAINYDGDGEIYLTIFSGPNAHERATEYAEWKMNSTQTKLHTQLTSASI